jgi:hypothetical protein
MAIEMFDNYVFSITDVLGTLVLSKSYFLFDLTSILFFHTA